MPDVKEKFTNQGFTADWRTPEDTRKYVQSEIQKWGAIVKDGKIKAD